MRHIEARRLPIRRPWRPTGLLLPPLRQPRHSPTAPTSPAELDTSTAHALACKPMSRPVVHESVVLGQGSRLGRVEALFPDATRWDNLLFLSGRAAVAPSTGVAVAADFGGQARAVLDDVLEVLAAAGSGPDYVLRVECWLADARDFGAWNELFAATFRPPRPVRTTLVSAFAVDGLLIEVQVTAGIARDGD